jgi:hypothetical protein
MVVGLYGGGGKPMTAAFGCQTKVEGYAANLRQGQLVDPGYRTRHPRVILTQHPARALNDAGALQKAASNRVQPGRFAGTALLLVGDYGRLKLR